MYGRKEMETIDVEFITLLIWLKGFLFIAFIFSLLIAAMNESTFYAVFTLLFYAMNADIKLGRVK